MNRTDLRADDHPLPWMQSGSGVPVDLVGPVPAQIVPTDMAFALARLPRFNGHLRNDVNWSVAAHSVMVCQLVRATTAEAKAPLYALLHDGHEAYVGDITSPLKQALGMLGGAEPLRLIVKGLDQAIHARFGLDWPPPPAVRDQVAQADLAALVWERRELLNPTRRPWSNTPEPDLPIDAWPQVPMMNPYWRHESRWTSHAAEFLVQLGLFTDAGVSRRG